jgi:hypothetical protein
MFLAARIFVVIEIVEQADDAPKILVSTQLPSIGAHAGLDGERMFAQTF